MAKDRTLYALLAYAFGWISGLILYFVEKDDKVIRFHAARSLIIFLGAAVLSMIPLLGFIIVLLSVLVWFYVIIKTLLVKGEKFEIPVLSGFVDKFAEELANK